MLKREVSSLNDELNTLLERVREAEEREAAQRGEMEGLREQAGRSTGVIRQLQSHHEDLQAAMDARDSQIQVWKEEHGRDKGEEEVRERGRRREGVRERGMKGEREKEGGSEGAGNEGREGEGGRE